MWAFIKTVSHHHRIVLGHGIAGVTYSEWRAVSSVGWVQLYPQPPLAPWPGARWGSGPLLWKENSVSFPVDTFKTITDSTQTLSAFYLHHARADPNNAGEHIPRTLPDRGLLPCFFPSCQRAVNTPPQPPPVTWGSGAIELCYLWRWDLWILTFTETCHIKHMSRFLGQRGI